MKGKIVKGIAGFYYVATSENEIYECKAKGAFRNSKVKPLVGDNVCFDIVDEDKKTGNLVEVLPRKNSCLRPEVANIDQALCFFTESFPELSLILLDKMLIWFEKEEVPCIICFNKTDIANSDKLAEYKSAYEAAGYKVCTVSVHKKTGLDDIKELLLGKTTTIAGPSGVGKSSFINSILESEYMATGEVSEKTEHGRHTTRHAELLQFAEESYIFDTPGFSSLDLYHMKPIELQPFYHEFAKYSGVCRFADCIHVGEPDCEVKNAVSNGMIAPCRYDTYKKMIQEIKDQKPVW